MLARLSLLSLASLAACSGRSGLRRVEHLEASANLKLATAYDRLDPAPSGSDARDVARATVGIRSIVGGRAGAVLGMDVALGAGLQGGLAYAANLRPLGVGLHIGRFATLGVSAGAGVDGLTDHIGFAVGFPVEATLTLELGRHLHLDGFVESRWIVADDPRQNGSSRAPFGDELSAGAAIRIGRGDTYDGTVRWGNGYFVGAAYGELLGVQSVGLRLGYGVSVHHRRR